MNSGCRIGRAPGNGRERRGHGHGPDRWQPLGVLLCVALMLATVPAAIWLWPPGLARAQDEVAGSDRPLPGQVIAQGIARLPRDQVAWTVRGIDVSADASMAIESFPVGFAIADIGTIALLDADGEVLNILATGEATFLPNGTSGVIASWEDGAASLYEVALVSGEDAAAGATAGTVVGEPFAAPEGAAFDVELARQTLTPSEQATIPISRSGAPVLLLQTAGSVQLESGSGQIAELTEGQFALLVGEIRVRGASDGPSTFVVAAIGEATAARDVAEAGAPETRAGREERRQAREAAQAEAAAPGEAAPGEEGTRERRPRRERTGGRGGGGGRGGQTAPQGTDGTVGVPITGAVDPTVPAGAPDGTPALEPTTEPALPADTTAPPDGTPTPDTTTPPDDETPLDETAVPADEAPADTTPTPEPTAPAGDAIPTEDPSETEPAPAVEAPPAADTPPLDEAPVVEVAPTEPVLEEEAAEPAAGA